MNKKEYKYTFAMCNGKNAVVTRDNKFDMEDLIKGEWVWIGDERNRKSIYLNKENIASITEEEIYL